MQNYGLRLQVTGLKGYFTLKSQAEGHSAGKLPMPEWVGDELPWGPERIGYRTKPGTSIAIRLNPGKLGVLNLREAVEKYLCGAKVPVYYNNERIGRTYQEIMQAAHELAGERIYELSSKSRQEFDKCFPGIRGQYPKLAIQVTPLDTEDNQPISDLSGVLVKYEVRYEQTPVWEMKDQIYEIRTGIECTSETVTIEIRSQNQQLAISGYKKKNVIGISWHGIMDEYDSAEVKALAEEFEKLSACPQDEESLGEVWQPFEKDMYIYEAWKAYCDYQYENELTIEFADKGCLSPSMWYGGSQNMNVVYAYQGVAADSQEAKYSHISDGVMSRVLFLLEGECKPVVEVSRSKIVELPLRTLIAICAVANKNNILSHIDENLCNPDNWESISLREWRQARGTSLDKWMNKYQRNFLRKSYENILKVETE